MSLVWQLQPLIPFLLCCLALFSTCEVARSADWVGAENSSFEYVKNWTERDGSALTKAPQTGGQNPTRLAVVNGTGFPLRYTGSEGATGFSEQMVIGAPKGSSGEMTVTGGSLTFQQNFPAIIGQTVEGKLTVQGGSLILKGGGQDDSIPGCGTRWSLFLGNEEHGKGVLTVIAGVVMVEGGLELGRQGGGGVLEISGSGRFTFGGPLLIPIGTGTKAINLGEGNGVFEQNKNGEILFLGDASQGWFSFNQRSRGKLSICGYQRADFDRMVREGRIRMDGRPTTPDHFSFRKNGIQGEYQLNP